MAGKLREKFNVTFCPGRVARKWQTVIDGYKAVKDNNSSTGRGAMRFKFFTEMDSLLGGQHDIVFPITGDNDGIVVRRPEVLGGRGEEHPDPVDHHTTPLARRPRGARGGALMQWL